MLASSLLLRSSSFLVFLFAVFSNLAGADTFTLTTEYSGPSFFENWSFFSGADPTNGFVTYVDSQTAAQDGLIGFSSNGDAVIKVDSTHVYNPNAPYRGNNGYGRPSVRIMSKDIFDKGLLIADIKHMPYGCGTWPAFWTLGADGNWPVSGEVDIIEGVNNRAYALAALHTGYQCKIAGDSRTMTGSLQNNDCFYNVQTGAGAVGCPILDTDPRSYGQGLNNAGGSVVAMLWDSDAIRIWSFPSNSVPVDISEGQPNPSNWGLPAQIFNGPDCDIDQVIAPQRVIFNTDFCGDFGEAVWSSEGCAAQTGYNTCAQYVALNPQAFTNAFWQIGYVRHYQQSTTSNIPTAFSSTTTRATTLSSSTIVTTSQSSQSSQSSQVVQPTSIPSFVTTLSSPLASTSTTVPTPITSVTVVVSFNATFTKTLTITPTQNPVLTSSPSGNPGFTTVTSNPSSWVSWGLTTTIPNSIVLPTTTASTITSLTTGSAQCSYFLPPMGSGVPITPGWNATGPVAEWESWAPIPETPPAIPTQTWLEWPDKIITTTLTYSWIEPCETGYTTKTTIFVTTHCGCTETPIPTVPVRVITTECPESWGFKTPVVITVPAIPTPAATWTAWPSEPTGGDELSPTWPAWTKPLDSEHETTSEEMATWSAWQSPPPNANTEGTENWSTWLAPEASSAAKPESWATWVAPESEASSVPSVKPETWETWATWSASSSTPASATTTSTSTASPAWKDWEEGSTTNPYVAKWTGAADRVAVSAGVLGALMAVLAFVL